MTALSYSSAPIPSQPNVNTSMATNIDTMPALQRFARELHDGASDMRRELILAILERWQFDADLTVQSRQRARQLLEQFALPHERR